MGIENALDDNDTDAGAGAGADGDGNDGANAEALVTASITGGVVSLVMPGTPHGDDLTLDLFIDMDGDEDCTLDPDAAWSYPLAVPSGAESFALVVSSANSQNSETCDSF